MLASKMKALVCALICCSWLAAFTVQANNIVYYESDLPLSYMDAIDPYAWSSSYPDPYYTAEHTATAPLNKFQSFLQLQSAVPVAVNAAHKYTHVPQVSLPDQTSEDSSVMASAASIEQQTTPALLETQGDDIGSNNPADDEPMKISSKYSAFGRRSRRVRTKYRRAVYGLRRRRMPFIGNSATLSLNPYRRPNSFFNTPPDMLMPRQRYAAALDPKLTDYGTLDVTQPAYGGYSSFAGQQIRRVFARGLAVLPYGDLNPALSASNPSAFANILNGMDPNNPNSRFNQIVQAALSGTKKLKSKKNKDKNASKDAASGADDASASAADASASAAAADASASASGDAAAAAASE